MLTEDTVRAVFGLRIIEDPVSERPLMLPIGRHHAGPTRGGPAPEPAMERETRC